jgi:nucleolar protein 53
MGKAAKGSRKGKKAWRANIRTDDIDEFYEKQTRDAHAGAAAIPSLPSDSLFFVDKPASASTSSAAADPPPQGPPTTLLSSASTVVSLRSRERVGTQTS